MNKEFGDLLKTSFSFVTVYPQCRDGWFLLLWNLCNDIKNAKPDGDFETTQIKEKFGTLRFYTTSIRNDEVTNTINKYELLSEKICDWCGRDGTLYTDGGCHRTRCDDHKNARVNIMDTLGYKHESQYS